MNDKKMEVSCWMLVFDEDCYHYETVLVLVGVTLAKARERTSPPRSIKKKPRRRRIRLLSIGEVPVSVQTEYAFFDEVLASASQ